MSNLNNKSILWQAQEVVAGILNSDEVLSGRVSFFPENIKEIDFELQNALGRQGIVGIVMTPQATYQGTFQGEEIVWDLIDFTVQVVENPAVNRSLSGSVTALDAAMRASECLASPLLSTFGIYCPKSVEQGEDSGLLVAQAKFDTTVRARHEQPQPPVPPFDYTKTYVKYAGSDEWVATPLSGVVEYEDTMPYYSSGVAEILFGTGISETRADTFGVTDFPDLRKLVFADGCSATFSTGTFGPNGTISALENFENTNVRSLELGIFNNFTALSSVSLPQSLEVIRSDAFRECTALTSISIPSNCTLVEWTTFQNCTSLKNVTINSPVCEVGFDAFYDCPSLESVVFAGRTTAQVREMEEYPWGIEDTSIIHGALDD